VLKFNKRFWPKELHGVICSDSIVPEFWFEIPERVGALTNWSSPLLSKKAPVDETTCVISGFACSEIAAHILSLPKGEAVKQVLKQLDDMFGSVDPSVILKDLRISDTERHTESFRNSQTPATDAFVDCHIQDWGSSPYVLGGYSSPSIGETAETRDTLAAHVNGKVFFCGEHTNRSYMTLNSAMKSGEVAAESVLKVAGTRSGL